MDWYTACLLGWFMGINPNTILSESKNGTEWPQETIDRAEKYCIEKHVDPIEYWA